MAIRGGDTRALRAYNERLILSALRQSGPLSRAELARATGLSAPAAATIVKALLDDGMILAQEKVRGRIGQPMTPLALDPRGAYSAGLKIGRRSVEAMLVDFLGNPVRSWRAPQAAPLVAETMAAARDGAAAILDGLSADQRARVVGLGVAMPSHLHLWAEELGLAADALAGWRDANPAAELESATGLPTRVYNDATAACGAEMALGGEAHGANALYVYVGAFVGGGLILNGSLLHGPRGNAAAIGSMPMPGADPDGSPRQLLHEASELLLEEALVAAGVPLDPASDGAVSPAAEAVFDAWCGRAAAGIARCIVSAASLVDLETVVVDGVLNAAWRTRLCGAIRRACGAFDWSGLEPVVVAEGSLGARARVLGAALLPLHARFSPQADLLMRGAQAPADQSPLAAQ